jgi:hypothetical protein
MVHQQVEQYRGPSHQTQIIAPIGLLPTALEIFDRTSRTHPHKPLNLLVISFIGHVVLKNN